MPGESLDHDLAATSGRIAIEAGLWFRYGRQKRPEVTASTTFDAVLRGERTSTTRFICRPGHDRWARMVPGDLVRFHENQDHSGRNVIVQVSAVSPIDLFRCASDELEDWSRHEGWALSKGRALGAELGAALWIRHVLLAPAAAKPPQQMSLF